MARECTKECIIKGMKIPEGLTVVISAYSIHRDPSIYPDPEKFDPERFSPEAKQSRDPYSTCHLVMDHATVLVCVLLRWK